MHAELRRLYEQGLSTRLVAQEVGRNQSYVVYRLRKMGILRSRSEAYKADFVRRGHGTRWRGGRYQTGRKRESKYWAVHEPGGPYRLEHVIIAESALGRKLRKGEVVHHVNGDTLDNRSGNLLICSNSYHMWLHGRMSQLYQAEHFRRENI